MNRAYYSNSIDRFISTQDATTLGSLLQGNEFEVLKADQVVAWEEEIPILKAALKGRSGQIYLEFSIPRMGRRADAVILIGSIVFVVEFKSEGRYLHEDIDQVVDYALDLKNFHEPSHHVTIVPILVSINAKTKVLELEESTLNNGLYMPLLVNATTLSEAIEKASRTIIGSSIDIEQWGLGRYKPTPTIIEAATALYRGHSVEEISRSDADDANLKTTSETISRIIETSKEKPQKSICFLTGVPGAGKTLVGLNIATTHQDEKSDLHSVFLSGNGPLVAILREALARDKVASEKGQGKKPRKAQVMSSVKAFIQNVHHFRDEYLKDPGTPAEHVVLFDEAQRAWTLEKTKDFMKRRKKVVEFNQSEPEFLISCMNRFADWAVIVCLVGGGQEIHQGEAGIAEWIESLQRSYPKWKIYISPNLLDSEYAAGKAIETLKERDGVEYEPGLHLSVSMRSYRAENVSLLVKQLLDLEEEKARITLDQLNERFPIVLTRDIDAAKAWLKSRQIGTQRIGIVASSQAERLRPHAIHVKAPMDPIHWFLGPKDDIRSSYYLEDVATEFSIQGLELDWVCVTWDADLRFSENGWAHRSFRGDKWIKIAAEERQSYQKNAYRVLLTRARQGMVICVPEGNHLDPTRKPEYYDSTYQYLRRIGFQTL